MKNIKTFELFSFPSKRWGAPTALPSSLLSDKSKIIKTKESEFYAVEEKEEKQYLIFKNKYLKHNSRLSMRTPGASYVVEITDQGLILHSDGEPSLIGDKRIKVPSIERALDYLTELKIAKKKEEEVNRSKYDESID